MHIGIYSFELVIEVLKVALNKTFLLQDSTLSIYLIEDDIDLVFCSAAKHLYLLSIKFCNTNVFLLTVAVLLTTSYLN